ncbi:MAG: phage tail spike protein [Staphylococcus rostri]|uniref:phage tail spike protein n=1 Tax=Staphylococcus rostri TaxID=522262 RepID=UPI0026DF5769|nr:phage tail spike protein [Staphylococcus rostri]MDO5375686.1 phage tail spike protein [Staphylococcus rostri]
MIYLLNGKKELMRVLPKQNFISASYEKEINGLYTSRLECPVFYHTNERRLFNHKFLFDNAVFFGLFDRQNRFQIYKIHERVIQNERLSILGVHLFFDEAKAMSVIRDIRPREIDAKTAIRLVFQNTGWEVADYDTTDLKSTTFYYLTPAEARKKIIETWNVEIDFGFVFDGKKVLSKELYIKNKLGHDTGKRFAYGSNILTIKQEEDSSAVFTAAIGRGKGEQVGDGYGRRIKFDDIRWSKSGYTKPNNQDFIEIVSATNKYGYYDESSRTMKPRFAVVEFDDIEDKQELADQTYQWLENNCVPKVSYSTTVAEIGHLDLGDEVAVIYKEVGIAKKARVQKIKVNMLNYAASTIDLGDYQYFKQDKAQLKMHKKVEAVQTETEHYITALKREFDANYEVQRDHIQRVVDEVETRANAQVEAAEGRMRKEIEVQKRETDLQLNRFENALIPINIGLTENQNAIDLANSEVNALTNRLNENYRYMTLLDKLANQNTAEITKTNAEIQKRVLKTDYDALTGRFQSQLNETTSTANGNRTLITELKTNVNNLNGWKTEKGQQIDETIDGYQRKVWREDIDELGKTVSKNTADIKFTNSEIEKRVLKTDYDKLTGRLQTQINQTTSTANGNRTLITEVTGNVNQLNDWKTAKGQQIDETIDGYQRKIWRNDIDSLVYDNENLIAKSDIKTNTKLNLEGYSDKGKMIVEKGAKEHEGIYITAETLEPFTEYIIRFKYKKISGTLTGFSIRKDGAFQPSGNALIDGKPTKVNYAILNEVYTSDDQLEHEVIYSFKTPSVFPKTDRFWIQPNKTSTTPVTVEISQLKLERGSKATAWTPSPKELENKVATIDQKADGIKLQADAIAQDYVKQSSVVVQADGVLIGSKKYSGKDMASAIAVTPSNVDIITNKMRVTGDMQVAGDIKSLSLNAVYGDIAKLKTNILTADSITASAIKSDAAMIDKLFANEALIDRLTSKSAFIKDIQAMDLSAERVRVAYNNVSGSVNITYAGLETVRNGQRTSLVDGVGHHFYHENHYVGHIGTGSIINYSNERGLRLTLDNYGKYMAFTYRTGKLSPEDPNEVAMLWSKGGAGYSRGFHFNEIINARDDIRIDSNHVLQTLYIRPNGAPVANRLVFGYGNFANYAGVSIKYNNSNGSGIHFSDNVVSLIARRGTSGGWADFKLFYDRVESITVYNRTYSSAANMFITQYGTIGRSTSASKYKLSQERQFKDDEQQYNHSKQILDLDIKTWFDRFESETYAREILTGERQEDEDFKLKRYAGLIAEDVESVGLNEFVTRGKDDEIEGIEYDRLWIHLIPIIKKQNQEIEKLKSEMELLKNG